ncbi:HAD family hydrolase [Actinophytocola sediminis]
MATTTTSAQSWCPVAHRRANRRGEALFGNDTTVLVGDTLNDVKAGLVAGVRVIGVATGKVSTAQLRDAGATWAVTNPTQAGNVLTSM